MKKGFPFVFLFFIFLSLGSNSLHAQSTYGINCADLFFSEYVEPGPGSSANKVIEIYNPKTTAVNLGNYLLGVSMRNTTTPGCGNSDTMRLPASVNLLPGDVYVVSFNGTGGLSPLVVAARDTTWASLNFNGNDAVYLINTLNGDTLDIFGEMCNNPGASWQINTILTNNSSKDVTLIRNPNIYHGEKDWNQIGMYQWTAYPMNTFTMLGSHTTFPCGMAVPPTVFFDSTYVPYNENSATTTLPLHIMFANSDTTKVDLSLLTGTGTASAGADYVMTTQTIIIPPYWNGLIDPDSVQIIDDLIIEPTEDFYVHLSNAQNVQMTPYANDTLRVDILDNDLAPTNAIQFLAPVNNSILEQNITLQIPVYLNASAAGPYTADVSVLLANTTATAGLDYNFTPSTLTFLNAQDTQYVTLDIYNDCACELLESIQLLVSNPSPGVAIGIDSIYTLDILANDAPPSVVFGAFNYMFSEGQLGQNIPVKLATPYCDTMHVYVAVNGASAYLPGSTSWDFSTAVNGTDTIVLTFAPGDTLVNIVLDLYSNTTFNPSGVPQSFDLYAYWQSCQAANGFAGGINSPTVNVLVQDTNKAPIFSMDSFYVGVSEGFGTLIVPVYFSNDYGLGGTVTVDATDITATNGQDYTFFTTNLVFGPTDTVQYLYVPIIQDILFEADETFKLSLISCSPSGVIDNVLNSVTDTILNDDIYTGPTVSVNFLQPTYVVYAEANMVVNIPVVTSGSTPSFPMTLDVNVDLLNTTATLGADFIMSNPSTITFASANDTQYVQFAILDDCVTEFLESVVLTMSNPVNLLVGQDSVYYLDIMQNDPTPSVSFSSNPTQTIGEAGGMLQIPVFLSAPFCDTVTVAYTLGGAALLPNDYTINGTLGLVTFLPGDTIEYITVNIVDDNLVEPTENIVLVLSNPTGATIGGFQTDVVSIIDNDVLAPTVYFGSTANTYIESAGTITIPVLIQNPSLTTASVIATLTSGTATVGSDVTGTISQTIIFPAGSTSPQNVTFTIVDDAIVEGTENFTIVLSNVVNATIGAANTFTGTITDNDNGNLQAVAQFQSTANTVKEGQTLVLNVPVYVSNPSASPVSVSFTVNAGTCLPTSDYVVITASPLIIPPFNTVNNIQINIVDDALLETPEQFSITLNSAQNANLGALTTMQIDVLDDDFSTGISSVNSESVKVYPSPVESNGVLTVERTQSTTANFQLMNLMGQVVFEQVLSSGKSQIQLDELSAGTYVYRIIENGVLKGNGQLVIEK